MATLRFPQILVSFLTALPLCAQIPGANVNMVSGTKWPDGDPFLQRQNEPSLAVSSRNPLHLLAGANDYRTVDLPGLPNGETGDAWLGIFKSYDGGQTWRSTLHPGCPQNVPQCGGTNSLKGFAAAADPVVRPGANGMFFYSGIAFTRTSPAKSTLFVSRFVDNNNEENGDPIKYLGTTLVAAGTDSTFIDKPWMAVDIPRAGAAACTISAPQAAGPAVQQSFPAGNIYVAYTAFARDGQPPSQIQFVRSTDCGVTWSAPIPLSDINVNQGATLAIDPLTGTLYVAWRRFGNGPLSDAILVAKSTDGGQTFTAPVQVASIKPFDQGTTDFSFRTSAYPTMAVDGSGRIYMAWSERGLGAPASGGDARIVITTSKDGGQTWTQRQPINDFPGRGHQWMPAMTFGGGKIMIVFYDLRDDATTANYTPTGHGQYSETRRPAGDLASIPPHPEKVFTPYILDAAPADLNEGGLLRRHTIDVWAAQAGPADNPTFSSARISQYVFGSVPGSNAIEQLQVNPPNFPLFSQGSVPFIGDYLDVAAAPAIVPGKQPGSWKFNTDPSPSIVFHAAWADNRDVRPPANGDWTDYTPPVSASTTGASVYDPTRPQPSCITGQTGMRNENIYTAVISQGLTVSSPSNSKTLGKIQRSFPVIVTNATNAAKTYRLAIVNQPLGGKASFLQFPVLNSPDPLVVLDVEIAPLSSISRMVFVTSTNPQAQVQVNIAEISAPGAPNLVPGGLQGSVTLNPDPLNPSNPAIANTEIFNPAIANPAIANPAIANPAIANPAIANPAIANPAIANPAIANLSASNADIANPAIANPAIANPAIANPAIANTAITDVNWALNNGGNSAGTYSLHFLTNVQIPSRVLSQLIVNKVYTNPVASGCSLTEQPQTIVLANISNIPLIPRQSLSQTATGQMISALLKHHRRGRADLNPLDTGDPSTVTDITDSSLNDATVTVGPGETVYVTLRFFNTDATQPLGFDPGQDITTVVVSESADTGSTHPPIASSQLIAATGSLAAGVIGAQYDDSLIAAGGTPPYTWTLVSGSLPAGLSLSPDGHITGTITGSGGVFNFTVQVTDSNNGPGISESLSIAVSGVGLAFTGVQASGPNGGSAAPGQSITVVATVANSGTAADAVTPNITLNATGSATASCGGPSPASASIPQGGTASFTFTCGSVAGAGSLTFSVGLLAEDATVGATLPVSPATSNAVSVLGGPPKLAVVATAGGSSYVSGSWTNQNVLLVFTCTPNGGDPSTQEITVDSEGANQSVSTSCTDLAGNTTKITFTGIFIDKTPPSLDVSATAGGQPYTPGTPTNQPVVVTFSCSDDLSGVSTQPGSQTINPPAIGKSVTGTCTDRAGNSATAVLGGITTLSAAPVVSAAYSSGAGAYTPGAWSANPVIVTFTCTPAPGVSVLNVTSPVTVSTEGANQFVTGQCTDQAGNTGQINAGPISVETTPPTLTRLPLPASSNGWYNAPVTISWSCSDKFSNGSQTISRTISTEGAKQVATATCANQAGTVVSDSQSVNVDLTKPSIGGSASPAPNASGWNTSPVTVSFTCSDTLSGVAPGNPTGGATLTADTNGSIVNGACQDVAGNSASAAVGPIRIDRTAPTIQFQSLAPVNAAGWSNSPVTVTWSCADAGSGPVSPTVIQLVTGEGSNLSSSGTCADLAGNTSSNTRTGIKIDTVAPSVRFFSPADGAVYPQNAQVVANYSCSDSLSLIASCTGDVPNGQPISTTPGPHTFTVTALDNAGNRTVVVHSYTVQAGEN